MSMQHGAEAYHREMIEQGIAAGEEAVRDEKVIAASDHIILQRPVRSASEHAYLLTWPQEPTKAYRLSDQNYDSEHGVADARKQEDSSERLHSEVGILYNQIEQQAVQKERSGFHNSA